MDGKSDDEKNRANFCVMRTSAIIFGKGIWSLHLLASENWLFPSAIYRLLTNMNEAKTNARKFDGKIKADIFYAYMGPWQQHIT